VLGPIYDPTGAVGENMASGDITAQFSRNVRVYDSLGTGHDVTFSFLKTAENTWAVEVYVTPPSDVNSTLANGQVATGNITFNGDGSLRSVSAGLTQPLNINWTNGSTSSSIALDLGTAGQPFGTVGATTTGETDGLSQFDSSYNVNFANQNGAPVGQLVSVAIDDTGTVIASYSNGQTQKLYQLPLASFANPDGLDALSGNVYSETNTSGEVNLREAGTNGTGTIVSASLEQSNVDLATQLTDMIVAQRSYEANTKVIKTVDDLLEALNQI
jgi:flagellar hook protein FlgE